MNFSDLQAFVSVARNASFSRAAEQLHLSQPAVSKRIATLESQLNAPLFDRIGRSILLTAAGQALLTHAQQILDSVEDSRRAIANLNNKVSGPITLATSHHIGLHRLPPILRNFSQHYPETQLDLRFMDSEAACQAVAQGEIELGVVTLPLEKSKQLRDIPLWRDPLILVSAPNHALCQHHEITSTLLIKHDAILPNQGTFTRALIDRQLIDREQPLKLILETNYLETIKMMVSIGLGWSILPASMIDSSLHSHTLAGTAIERTLGLIHHPQRTLSNAARHFINCCTEHADRVAFKEKPV